MSKSLIPPRTNPDHWLALIAIVAAFALIVAKPVHIDDAYYLYLARHIAEHPASPYGAEVFWQVWPEPTLESLVPPVLPYVFAASIALFGDSVLGVKLALLPFVALFLIATRTLVARFSGLSHPVAWLLVAFSPAFIVGWNLMLDLPAMAIGLAATALFIGNSHRPMGRAALFAVGAGLAVAAQTKYPALTYSVVVLIWGAFAGCSRRAVLCVALAGGLFVGCEVLIWAAHGKSIFFSAISGNLYGHRVGDPAALARALAGNAGILLLPMLPLVGAVAGGRRPGAAVAVAAVSGALALGWPILTGAGLASPEWSFGVALFALSCLAALLAYWAFAPVPPVRVGEMTDRTIMRFLLLWLLLEIVAAMAMSPFGAARRVIGIVFVVSLLALRAASAKLEERPLRRVLVLAAIVCGLWTALLQWVDIQEARAQRLRNI